MKERCGMEYRYVCSQYPAAWLEEIGETEAIVPLFLRNIRMQWATPTAI